MLQSFVDIVLEALLFSLLLVNSVTASIVFIFKTSLSHGKIVHNQAQVSVNSSEMDNFTFHDSHLFVKLLDLNLTRSDVSLQLLDLVIKHEFELF